MVASPRIVSLALLSLALAAGARGANDAAPVAQSRATIRGSGKDVTIVYRGRSPASRPVAARTASPGDAVLAEAVRLKSGGADDSSVLAYLQNHQSELAPVTGIETVRQLRRAGASASFLSALSKLTALEIGETGEGAPVSTAYASEIGVSDDAFPFANAQGGYPFYGSTGFFPRHASGRRFTPQRPSMVPGRAVVPGGAPLHARSSRAGMPRFPQP